MREIKFRGKRIDNGEWVYGFLFELSFDGYPITCIGTEPLSANDYSEIYKSCYEEVIPETVGQYTGLKDKNGKEIYEGDIVETIQPTGCKTFMPDGRTTLSSWINKTKNVVEWQDDNNPRWKGCLRWGSGTIEVIGNIYEHPERIPEVHHDQ